MLLMSVTRLSRSDRELMNHMYNFDIQVLMARASHMGCSSGSIGYGKSSPVCIAKRTSPPDPPEGELPAHFTTHFSAQKPGPSSCDLLDDQHFSANQTLNAIRMWRWRGLAELEKCERRLATRSGMLEARGIKAKTGRTVGTISIKFVKHSPLCIRSSWLF